MHLFGLGSKWRPGEEKKGSLCFPRLMGMRWSDWAPRHGVPSGPHLSATIPHPPPCHAELKALQAFYANTLALPCCALALTFPSAWWPFLSSPPPGAVYSPFKTEKAGLSPVLGFHPLSPLATLYHAIILSCLLTKVCIF